MGAASRSKGGPDVLLEGMFLGGHDGVTTHLAHHELFLVLNSRCLETHKLTLSGTLPQDGPILVGEKTGCFGLKLPQKIWHHWEESYAPI